MTRGDTVAGPPDAIPVTPQSTIPAAILLLLTGGGQVALLVAAFARVVDPGPVTFDVLGVIVGPGTGLLVGLLVVAGWIVLALWEVALGRWLLRSLKPASGLGHAPHA